ncbi:MAG: S41 family peptidase [Bacteroidota bacterium]
MRLLFLLLLALLASGSYAQPTAVVSAADLTADYAILRQTLEELHPGLYKYTPKEEMDQYFAQLANQLSNEQDVRSAYRHISELTAHVQCGHTYANFWNQSAALTEYFTEAKDKLPFTTRIMDQKVYIAQNLSNQPALQVGDQITAINGRNMDDVLAELLALVKSDGANDGKRYFDLQLFGMDNYEAFDIYLPLVLELGTRVELQLLPYQSDTLKTASVDLTTRRARHDTLTARHGPQIETYDDFWNFELLDEQVGYLQIGTFVTWKMDLNWKQFIDDAFSTLAQQNTPNLILDIRGNAGGNADVQAYLYKKLRKQSATQGPFRRTLRTNTISPTIRPYLHSWSNKAFNDVERAVPHENGFYTFKRRGLLNATAKAEKGAYNGKVYVLADASNSSGTYFLIHYLQQNDLATVVGQTSGGNLQGITGGQILMLVLPHTGIAVDIPLIGYYPPTPQPNQGITPDIFVEPTIADLVAGEDRALKTALQLVVPKE